MISQSLCILGEEVELVDDYKCMGVTLNSRLDWKFSNDAVYDAVCYMRCADSTSWGSCDPSICAARCWRSFTSLWFPVYYSLLWLVGVDINKLNKLIMKPASLTLLRHWPPSLSQSRQTTEHFLKQIATAPLLWQPAEEIFPAPSHYIVH